MNELLHLYINNGISLFSEGENTVIAPKDIALKLLDIIKNLNIIILGGDIYMKDNENIFLHTYDSWHYDGHSSLESIEKSRNYLLLLNDENLVVENTIKQGQKIPSRNGITQHYDASNKITVFTNNKGGVVTVRHGK